MDEQHKTRAIENALQIDGLMSRDELSVIYGGVQSHGHKKGLEIGCYKGRTTSLLASLVDELHVVDVFSTGRGEQRPEYDVHTQDMVASILDGAGVKHKIFVGEVLDSNIADVLLQEEYDFVFVDGDHRYETLIHELELYRQITYHILGHDGNNEHVMQAIRVFTKKHRLSSRILGGTNLLWEMKY